MTYPSCLKLAFLLAYIAIQMAMALLPFNLITGEVYDMATSSPGVLDNPISMARPSCETLSHSDTPERKRITHSLCQMITADLMNDRSGADNPDEPEAFCQKTQITEK